MFRIDNIKSAITLPDAQPIGPNPGGFFTEKTSTLPATKLTADVANAWQEELCAVIAAASIPLDKTVNTQLRDAIDILYAVPPAPGINSFVEDPAPTLGGNLDVNNFAFITTSNADINIIPDTGGHIVINGLTTFGESLKHKADLTNKITFTDDTQEYFIGGNSKFDISTTGIRLGGANARITEVDNDTTLSADSATKSITQHAYKGYIATLVAATLNAKTRRFYGGAANGLGWGGTTASSANYGSLLTIQSGIGSDPFIRFGQDSGSIGITGYFSDFNVYIPAALGATSVTFALTIYHAGGGTSTHSVTLTGATLTGTHTLTSSLLSYAYAATVLATWNGSTRLAAGTLKADTFFRYDFKFLSS